jgi:hypothetical protein
MQKSLEEPRVTSHTHTHKIHEKYKQIFWYRQKSISQHTTLKSSSEMYTLLQLVLSHLNLTNSDASKLCVLTLSYGELSRNTAT